MISELELILLLARGTVPAPLGARARALLSEQLDWELILERVIAEDVYPLFYKNLCDLGLQIVPTERRKALHDLARMNALRSTLLSEELARALKLFNEAGIAAIALKGAALAQSLYGDPTLRTCVDIDVLVPRRTVARAFKLLLAEGYTSEFAPGFFADVLLRNDIEYALTREDRGFRYLLELHWGILWGGRFDDQATKDLWAEADPGTVFGVPAYGLSPEWQLLFLAAHAGRHQWQGLKWLVDIHEIVSFSEIDWNRVSDKAKRLGWEELLRITFHACARHFDTPIPSGFARGALPPWLKLYPASSSPTWKDAFLANRFLRRPAEKLEQIFRVFFIPTLAERRLLTLPALLGPLYYPLRPLRLGFKWSRSLVAKGLGQGAGS